MLSFRSDDKTLFSTRWKIHRNDCIEITGTFHNHSPQSGLATTTYRLASLV